MFTQITTLISFAVGILVLGFLIIVIFRWFLRRSLKIRANSYEDQPYSSKSINEYQPYGDKPIIDNPADEIDSSSFFDEWNIKKNNFLTIFFLILVYNYKNITDIIKITYFLKRRRI